jgi:hypothetical protein
MVTGGSEVAEIPSSSPGQPIETFHIIQFRVSVGNNREPFYK